MGRRHGCRSTSAEAGLNRAGAAVDEGLFVGSRLVDVHSALPATVDGVELLAWGGLPIIALGGAGDWR
jgi:hypothetical protein